MTEEEKIFAGLLFCPGHPSLAAIKRATHKLNQDYNRLYEDDPQRGEILKQIVGKMGKGVYMQGPITFHYGKHTTIGDRVFINFNFTVQDDGKVTIGNDCNFGPNVTIVTPIHPMLPAERKLMLSPEGVPTRYCYAKPVTIGNDVWVGANVTILPGVTIGDGCVIGAGAVVTKSVPAGSFAAGNPARVIRTLSDADSMKYKTQVLGGCTVIEDQQ